MTANPSDTHKTKNLAPCHAISPPSERCNKLPVICYIARSDQLHCLQKNRVDHTPLHLERRKGYIPPSFHHHFGRRWRSPHARPHNTYAQNTIHAASLHQIDEGCTNIFPSFSNLNLDSICLDRGGDFFPCDFSPALVMSSYFTLLDVMGDLWSQLPGPIDFPSQNLGGCQDY